jgi:hypothetical protein
LPIPAVGRSLPPGTVTSPPTSMVVSSSKATPTRLSSSGRLRPIPRKVSTFRINLKSFCILTAPFASITRHSLPKVVPTAQARASLVAIVQALQASLPNMVTSIILLAGRFYFHLSHL